MTWKLDSYFVASCPLFSCTRCYQTGLVHCSILWV